MRHGAWAQRQVASLGRQVAPLVFFFSTHAFAADVPKPGDFPDAPSPSVAPFDEFQSKPRHVNLRIDPISPLLNFDLLLKEWGASLDIALLHNLTLGPAIRGGPAVTHGDSHALVHKVGVAAGYYLNGNNLTDSFVIWPSAYFWSIPSQSAAGGDQIVGEMDCREVSLQMGFQWFYSYGWNFNLAGGLKYRYRVQNAVIVDSQGGSTSSDLSTGLSLTGELLIGWAF